MVNKDQAVVIRASLITKKYCLPAGWVHPGRMCYIAVKYTIIYMNKNNSQMNKYFLGSSDSEKELGNSVNSQYNTVIK